MIPRATADWPAAAASPTDLPDLFLRRMSHPSELAKESRPANRSSDAPANPPCDLTLDPPRSPFRVCYSLGSVPIRSWLRCGLGPSASRRFQ
jgi:hypothetical protein